MTDSFEQFYLQVTFCSNMKILVNNDYPLYVAKEEVESYCYSVFGGW